MTNRSWLSRLLGRNPVCGSNLEIFRLPREAVRAPEGLAGSERQGPVPLAVLAKAGASSVLEAVRRSAPCPVGWLVPGWREGLRAVVVAVDCADMDLGSTFEPLKELAEDGVPIIAGLLSNTGLDVDLSELVEMEMRAHLDQWGYPGDNIPVLRLEQAEDLKMIIQECGIRFEV